MQRGCGERISRLCAELGRARANERQRLIGNHAVDHHLARKHRIEPVLCNEIAALSEEQKSNCTLSGVYTEVP